MRKMAGFESKDFKLSIPYSQAFAGSPGRQAVFETVRQRRKPTTSLASRGHDRNLERRRALGHDVNNQGITREKIQAKKRDLQEQFKK